jgi:type II secretory pathway component HofQ
MPARFPLLAAALLVASGLVSAQPPPAPARPAPRAVVVAPPSLPIAPGALISLSVKDADLVEVVRSLARIAGLNLVLDPGVRGTVTAELTNVPWDRALAVILRINGLGMELDGRIITVAPPARLYATP